jgi:hypothetical protein
MKEDGMIARVTNGVWESEDDLLTDLLTKATAIVTRRGSDAQLDYVLATAACALLVADIVATDFEQVLPIDRLYRVN